jgi:hypothetical protein
VVAFTVDIKKLRNFAGKYKQLQQFLCQSYQIIISKLSILFIFACIKTSKKAREIMLSEAQVHVALKQIANHHALMINIERNGLPCSRQAYE